VEALKQTKLLVVLGAILLGTVSLLVLALGSAVFSRVWCPEPPYRIPTDLNSAVGVCVGLSDSSGGAAFRGALWWYPTVAVWNDYYQTFGPIMYPKNACGCLPPVPLIPERGYISFPP
jgi:hypothetical protein